jgi:hypothetical protein
MPFNLPAGILLVGGAAALILSLFVQRRWTDRTVWTLAIFQFGVAVICFAYAFELVALGPAHQNFLGLAALHWMGCPADQHPLFYPVVYPWTRKDARLLRLLLISLPIVMTIAQITNPLHHQYYTAVWLDTSGSFPMFAKTNGMLYWIYKVYAFGLFMASVVFLIPRVSMSKRNYRSQANYLMAGLMMPVLAELLYQANFRPMPYLNLTPFSYLLSRGFFDPSGRLDDR